MATQPKIFKFEDSKTGKIYQIEGDPDTTEAEAIDYLSTVPETELTQYEFNQPTAAPVVAPTSAQAAPQVQQVQQTPQAPAPELAPNAILGANAEQVVATKTLEEVPLGRELLERRIREGAQFHTAQEEFNQNFPGVTLPPDMASRWAEIQQYMTTPEGRQYYTNNNAVDPVNRATGVEDVQAPDSALEEFGVSAQRSLANMANTVTGAAGVAADIVGADETAAQLADQYLASQAAIGMNYPTSAGKAVDIRSFDDFGRWAASTLGELAPQLTSSLGAGAVGGLVGRKLVERKAADFIEAKVAEGVARDVAEREVAKQVQKATVRGGIVGAGATSEVQEVGSIYGDTYGATGERKPWTSLLAGTVAASLDTVLPARILSKVGGPVANDIIVDKLVKRIGKEAAAGFLTEGGTEALQTIIEQLPAGEVDWDSVVEAALRGGFGGSVASGAAGAYEGNRQAKANPALPEVKSLLPEGSAPITVPTATGRTTKAYKQEIADTSAQVDTRIKELTGGWQNAPQFEVHQNFSKLKGVSNNAVGALGPDGKVLINTENLIKQAKATNRSVDDMLGALTYHEGLGHHGLAELFGKALDDKLATILGNSTLYQQRVQKWLAKNPDAYLGDENRDIRALEEIMAERSEKKDSESLPSGYVNVMKNTVKDFGRKMGLGLQYSTREVETILGMAHSAVINGKGRNVGSNGYKYMYAGQNAANLTGKDTTRLEYAKNLTRSGIDKEKVRQATGWFKGEDGQWRFEISDDKSNFKKFNDELLDEIFVDTPYENTPNDMRPIDGSIDPIDALNNPALREKADVGSLYLHEVLDHPELFAAYPELEDIHITRENSEFLYPQETQNLSGYWDKDNKTIYINTKVDREEAKSAILHEVQHAIQDIEGFSVGGNRNSAVKNMTDTNVIETAQNFIKMAREKNDSGWDSYADLLQEHIDKNDIQWLRDHYVDPKSAGTFVGAEAYHYLSGEMEARDTEARQNMTPEERQNTKPYTAENLHPDYLIHSQGDEGTANATVYHGSPHDFDEFDHSKMGTGEGAQVYGWGTYLTETKDIAEGYKRNLSKRNLIATAPSKLFFGLKTSQAITPSKLGKMIVEHPLVVEAFPQTEENSKPKPLEFGSAFDDSSPQTYVPYKVERRRIKYAADTLIQYMEEGMTLPEALTKANDEFGGNSFYPAKNWELAAQVLADLNVKVKGGGKLYEVEIPDDATWLAWDFQQEPEVKEKLAKAGLIEEPSPQYKAELERLIKQTNKNLQDTYSEMSRYQREVWDKNPDMAYEDIDQMLMEVPEYRQLVKNEDELSLARDGFVEQLYSNGTGEEIYNTLKKKLKSDKKASLALDAAGIIGARYLDGNSRHQGQGTYNYVVYNDKTPKIINKYMMMTSPDKVEFTPEDIANMSPEDIIESKNAMDLLERMAGGYTPTVMSLDDLEDEVRIRGLSTSQILNQKSFAPGEITKRLFMFDIAMSKLDEQIANLYSKMQNGTATATDRSNFLKADFKRQELAHRIWDEHSEVARTLAAMKQVRYTRRKIEGTLQMVAQIGKGSPYEFLNDPDEFFKYATSIQEQINAGREKMKDKGSELLGHAINTPRALMSTLDLSAPLRQGIFLIHKGAWWRSFFSMFRFAGSDKAFNDLQEEITNRPTYGQMLQGNLGLSNLGSKLSQREEIYMSNWPEKIPGFGRLVKGSERAYVGFLNKLRADVFDELVSKLPDPEQPSVQSLKDIAAFINSATGRGNLPNGMRGAAPTLNALFFSPRLIASRIDMSTRLLRPSTYTKLEPVARKEYIKSIFALGSAALLITSLAFMAGAEVEKDPRSSDFAKIKVGNTRYDILGGEGQYITLVARLVKNSYKTADGDIRPYGNEFGQQTRLDAIGRFTTNKTAPIASFILDYFRGVDAIGQKFELDKAVLSRMVPMMTQDVQEVIHERGVGTGLAMSAPSIFGVGVQTYPSASLDTERELEAPVTFDMKTAKDGDYGNATVEDGVVMLDDKAQLEWTNRLNFYYKEWMKDETSKPEWKTMTADEKREIIKAVRNDARKETKADMLEVLNIKEEE